MDVILNFFNNIIHSSYTVLFSVDAALFLLAALGAVIMVKAKRKIKKHSVPESHEAPVAPLSRTPAIGDLPTAEPLVKRVPVEKPHDNHDWGVPKMGDTGRVSRKTENLDAEYARENGLIVCKYCETINTRQSTVCCACGNKISF